VAELRLTVQVGLRNRAMIRRALEEYCFQRGLSCEVSNERRWFSAVLHVTIRGPDRYIEQVRVDCQFLFTGG
jgi:hypothetical protein